MKIIGFIGAAALMVPAVTEPLVAIFARPDNPVYGLAVTGNRIRSSALVFIGFNVFASGMFTALSNGLVSAVLAFSRSFVFMVAAMLILPGYPRRQAHGWRLRPLKLRRSYCPLLCL